MRLAILGYGLIGASLARAARSVWPDIVTAAYDPAAGRTAEGRGQGYLDRDCTSPEEAVHAADIVLIAAPPDALSSLSARALPHVKPGALVMDTASIKQAAMEAILPHVPPHASFVPAHPIAGGEKGGPENALPTLFQGVLTVLTPSEPVMTDALKQAKHFWEALGARVEFMPPDLHDRVYAYVSHLPHMLAFAYGRLVRDHFPDFIESSEVYCKFTRIGGANRVLWKAIFQANDACLSEALTGFRLFLAQFYQELKAAPQPAAQHISHDVLAVRLPHLIATCLIAAIAAAEAEAGFSFREYAGKGLADFTAPASGSTESEFSVLAADAPALAHISKLFEAAIATETSL